MRLNRYIASYSSLSRRKADKMIELKKVQVNRKIAHHGLEITDKDTVVVDGKKIIPLEKRNLTIMLNKPEGYVCSKDGQGSPTVYDLLQGRMKDLNIAGRLDKDSSGLVILTSDGKLLNELSHPSYSKEKVYITTIDKPLSIKSFRKLSDGVDIGGDRPSKMKLLKITDTKYRVTLEEGRNRQIRRSFEAIGIKVLTLNRTQLGPYNLGKLKLEQFKEL